ncbi:MAG: hypothetical protein A2Z81_02760 [Omnitrophica WOR_2 bacterium GWA2_45_18]|nr:MAG: hypothetical protein A2Z81_02760 [Omnitrophica WOR_2 bacterium GWA2_45_18]
MKKIKSFSSEIDAILKEIKGAPGKTLKSDLLRERLIQLLESWYAMKAYVQSFYSDSSSLAKIDGYLEQIARDAHKKVQKSKYSRGLSFVQSEIRNKIQIEEIKAGVPLAETSSHHETQVKFLDEIPDVLIQLTPKSLVGWKTNIKNFLQKNPFDQNIFIMTRYASSADRIIESVVNAVKDFSNETKSFNPIIANKNKITDDLFNPIACLLCCRYGIAIFDKPAKDLAVHNPNVAYELGYMHLLQRECLLLKSDQLKAMPTDILHKLYVEYSTAENAAIKINNWLSDIAKE